MARTPPPAAAYVLDATTVAALSASLRSTLDQAMTSNPVLTESIDVDWSWIECIAEGCVTNDPRVVPEQSTPVTIPQKLLEVWRKKRAEGAKVLMDHQDNEATWSQHFPSLTNLRRGDRLLVGYRFSKSIQNLSTDGRGFGRLYGVCQRIPSRYRGLVFGHHSVELDLVNSSPNNLYDLALRLVWNDDAEAMRSELPAFTAYVQAEQSPLLARVQSDLQAAVDARRTWDTLLHLKSTAQVVREEALEPHSAFTVTPKVAKRHLLSMLNRRLLPPIHTPDSRALFEDGERLWGRLREYAVVHPDSYLHRILGYVRRRQQALGRETKQRHRAVANEETQLPILRTEPLPGGNEYGNEKGSFLSLVAQEAERQIMAAVIAYLRAVVERHNEGAQTPWHTDWARIHDGIVVPFVIPTEGIDRLVAFVRQHFEGLYRPRLACKPLRVPEATDKLYVYKKERVVVVTTPSTFQRNMASWNMNEERFRLVMRMSWHRFVHNCDIWEHPDGRVREGGPLTPEEYCVWMYRDMPAAEVDAMREFFRDQHRLRLHISQDTVDWDGGVVPGFVRTPFPSVTQDREQSHLLDYDEYAWFYSRVYFKVENPLEPSKPYLERRCKGSHRFLGYNELVDQEQATYCRLRNDKGEYYVVKFITEWISSRRSDNFKMRSVQLRHLPPRNGRTPWGSVVAPEENGIVDPQSVFNTFPRMESDFMRGAYGLRAMELADLERHPAVLWFQRHLRGLIAEPPIRHYYLDWFSYLVQYPHSVPGTYLLMYSKRHGVGKSLAMLPVAYGLGSRNTFFAPGGGRRIFREDGFTEGRDRVFVVVEEISPKQVKGDVLNAITTASITLVRRMHHDAENTVNLLHLVLQSNALEVAEAMMGPRDRRCVGVLCADTWDPTTHPDNHRIHIKEDMVRIFAGPNGKFDATNFNETSVAAVMEWLKRRDIVTFSPQRIPQTAFMRRIKIGRHVLAFVEALACTRYVVRDGRLQEYPVVGDDASGYAVTMEELHGVYGEWMKTHGTMERMPLHCFRERILAVNFLDIVPDFLVPSPNDPTTFDLYPGRIRDVLQRDRSIVEPPMVPSEVRVPPVVPILEEDGETPQKKKKVRQTSPPG